jgi:ligand-binding sensor domain-containing protein/two-component sensor histidine kinase
MLQRFIFFLFLFIANYATFAQHPYYYNITDEDGLPSNEVYSIVQDNFGYIWIGCDAGLFRYDGFNFKPYTNSKQNGRSISFLQLDKKGRLWCKNFSGQIYRVEKDSLFIVGDFSSKASSTPQFTLDDECNLYVNATNLIEVYSENGYSIKAYSFPERGNMMIDITELIYFNGKVIFSRNQYGVYALDLNSGKTTQLECEKDCENFWNRNLFKIMDNELYILAESSRDYTITIGKVNDTKIELVRQFDKEIDAQRVYMIYKDKSKQPWLCSYNGISTWDGYQQNKFLLRGQNVSNMLHDREGNYWFTTLEHGLFVIPFMEVQKINSTNSDLKEDNFTAITKLPNGNLLAGSYTGELYEISQSDKNNKSVYSDSKEKFITVKKIRETKYYLLVSRGRFTIIEKKTGKTFYPSLSNFRDMVLLGDTLFFVMPEAAGKIHIHDLIVNKKLKFIPVSMSGGRAVEAYTTNSSVYFALNEGTFIYQNAKLNELKDGEEKIYANSLSFSDGILWVASVSKGIYGVKHDKIVQHFSDKNGLNDNTMRYIKSQGNTLVACSNSFLYSLSFGEGGGEAHISKYNITSGINPKDINAIEIANSTVVLATNKGLVYFPLSLQSINTVEPNIAITTITHGDSTLHFSSSVELPYHNNNFKIYFSSAAFRSRGNFTYEYRLKGLDTAWISTPASVNYSVFSSIPPGDFLFEVRAVNESGVMSRNIASIGISVSIPVWQQWWFYLLVSLLSVGLVVLMYQFRIRYLTRKAALQNKLTASQLTALKAQMNPHFMYNALNSIQDLILQSDIKNTNYYLSRFSSLMRKVLDASGSNEITLNDEVEMLELYLELEKLRFGNDFIFTITVQKELDKDETKLPSLILQLFVENAIKHGLLHKKGEKKLSVEFILHNNTLVCTVTDNGVGRARSAEIKQRSVLTHQSFATKATEKRLELINSSRQKKIKLEVSDLMEGEKALGTKVVLEIPFSI